jgi:tryptophan halogenase
MEIPDSLAQRIALFRDDAFAYQAADELFRVDSWVQVMLGQRLEPRGHHAVARLMSAEQLRGALASIAGQIDAAVAKLPPHQAFLDGFCRAGRGTGATEPPR